MSRFKTDYLALPDTMAAVGQQPSAPQDALTSQSDAIQQQQPEQLQQQLPPPPQRHPQQQLPGPPPRFQDNSAAAAAAVIEQPQDGAAMADAFLSSLGMEMAAAASNQGEPGPQGHKQQVQTQPGSESDAGASTGESVQHDRLSAYFTHARLVTVA